MLSRQIMQHAASPAADSRCSFTRSTPSCSQWKTCCLKGRAHNRRLGSNAECQPGHGHVLVNERFHSPAPHLKGRISVGFADGLSTRAAGHRVRLKQGRQHPRIIALRCRHCVGLLVGAGVLLAGCGHSRPSCDLRQPQRALWDVLTLAVGSLDTGISREGLYSWCTNAAPAWAGAGICSGVSCKEGNSTLPKLPQSSLK